MSQTKRLSAEDLQNIYTSGENLVCLTAYTTPVARVLDKHCDLLLVGDSLGMVVAICLGSQDVICTNLIQVIVV